MSQKESPKEPQKESKAETETETGIESLSNSNYWRANIRLMLSLLSVWFFVSFVCGILIVDYLNQFAFFGFKLGFWFSQQGAIYFFVMLIFVYVWRMNKLDRQYGVDEEE
jgi:putative solute:sodium symporter small subunit